MSEIPIPIGRLSEEITLEAPYSQSDGAGGETVTWTPIATTHARIEPAQAREQIEADRLDGFVSHRVLMRYRTDLLGGMRILYRDRILRVLVARDLDETRRFTMALCEEAGR